MKIEVVLFVPPGSGLNGDFTFENVDSIETDSDTKCISILDDNGEVMAEFRDWTYWRKLSD